MNKRNLFAIFLTFVLMFSSCVPAFAFDSDNATISPTDFALKQVAVIGESDAECPWSEKTVIDSTITLYNMEQKPNGFVFKLKTGATESGFIQIHVVDDACSLYCYAYEGNSEIECMTEYWKIDLNKTSHIYFIGSFKYLIGGDDGRYLDVSTNSYVDYSRNELKTIEKAYASRVEKSPVSIEASSSMNTQKNATPRGSDDEFTWPITSDFTGLSITHNGITQTAHDHCTPTAATAIVRYLNHLGRTQCSAGETVNQTFREMYIALNTNEIRFEDSSYNGTGTARTQIVAGINYYATQNGTTLTVAKPLLVTLSGMKSHLNKNRLLLVSLDDFAGTSGRHSVVVTGYSSDILRIQNGWSRDRVSYAYSSLDIAQYVYIGA
ncbi:MAG: C39 family peptidase [Clostridia bacterium]|nr:C39 family peptidase [Clostridia bacterium]